jgi:hypothetical protein
LLHGSRGIGALTLLSMLLSCHLSVLHRHLTIGRPLAYSITTTTG